MALGECVLRARDGLRRMREESLSGSLSEKFPCEGFGVLDRRDFVLKGVVGNNDATAVGD